MTDYTPWALNKNKSVWVGACSGWALNRTWMLIRKLKKITAKSVSQVNFSQKS